MSNTQDIFANATSSVVDWVRTQKIKTSACRECDFEVTMTESVCPRCGQSDPARVPMSAATAIFALSACVILAVLSNVH